MILRTGRHVHTKLTATVFQSMNVVDLWQCRYGLQRHALHAACMTFTLWQ